MIFLGAGSSVPFEIPDMKKFVELFKVDIKDDLNIAKFVDCIEKSLLDSERLIGYNLIFDLESLLVVLQDIAADLRKPVSPPTFAFVLSFNSQTDKRIGENNIKNIRQKFGPQAKVVLNRLQHFVFKTCMEPIKGEQEEEDCFSFIDAFFGPLCIMMHQEILAQTSGEWFFTTNWDLCLKQWLECKRIPFEDGTQLDLQRKPVLQPTNGWSQNSTLKVVPLHGSYDFVKCNRYFSRRASAEIQKVSNPEVYFNKSPLELAKAFIVYPLEAVGYDLTMRSPYLDMLTLLKKQLQTDPRVFVIGFSFRDSIIASIFEEVLREKSQCGNEKNTKILLVDRAPQTVIDNLERQDYSNLVNAITPIEVCLPNAIGFRSRQTDFINQMQGLLNDVCRGMRLAGIAIDQEKVNKCLKSYGLAI
jgi:hypothetical protein